MDAVEEKISYPELASNQFGEYQGKENSSATMPAAEELGNMDLIGLINKRKSFGGSRAYNFSYNVEHNTPKLSRLE
jgi:hypothetical protein